MNAKPCVVILSGMGSPAIAAANIYYKQLSNSYRIFLIEEKNLTMGKIVSLLKRRWRAHGLIAVIDLLLLRFLFLFRGGISCRREYVPNVRCNNINDDHIIAAIIAEKPAWIITNACSIVGEVLLSAVKVPILNVHNGITPRYRGTGNFWAVREDNPSLVGVTVHRIDKGIDTGERIAMASIAVEDPRCATLEGMDVAAFEDGAGMICRYLLHGQSSIPGRYKVLRSCCYSFPGFSEWLAARGILKRWRSRPGDSEQIWKKSFDDLAANQSLDSYQRMHWGKSATVKKRDDLIFKLAENFIKPCVSILDVGGGDGRLATRLESDVKYVCADYTLEFMKGMGRDPEREAYAIQCDARSLPFSPRSFDLVVSVGLLQHISEAQRVVDDLLMVKKNDGVIILNTLRQFSNVELLLIIAGSLFSKNRRTLAYSILKRDYFSGRKVGGILVARRYTKRELIRMFRWDSSQVSVIYDGLLDTAFFAREITVVLR